MVNRISPNQIDVFFIRRMLVLMDVFVPAGQNYVVLSVAGSETPAETLTLDSEIEGVIAALLPSTSHAFSTNSIAGPNVLTPKNIAKIRAANNLNPILSSGREVYALLQVPSDMITGDAFDDSTHQLQLSFVRENIGGTVLEPCPVVDIENTLINYQYSLRLSFKDITEFDFKEPNFQEPNQSGSGSSTESSFLRLYSLMGA